MAAKPRPPLIDADGEARTPTAEEWLWAIKVADFGSIHAVQAFKARRMAILKAGAGAGLSPEYFLQFGPTKPGFEDRVATALGPVLDTTQHAAE